jgi:glycosyl hydrolase family 113
MIKSRYYYVAIRLLSVLGVILVVLGLTSENGDPHTLRVDNKIRGVCWVGGDSISIHNFDDLIANNVQWISQTPFGWQPHYNTPELQFESNGWYWGERDIGIEHTAQLAHQRGLKSVLKPHIWLRHSGGKWRGDIEMENAEDWDKWFENYSKFILHYANVARESNIEMLCIGTELLHPAIEFPDKWRALIKEIRGVYQGKLTYAANFHLEYEAITWWDALDYIGIQAYFPLAVDEAPTFEQIKRGWKPHVDKMKEVANKYGKPIILTEVGYRNDVKAASEPWLWPSQIDQSNIEVSDEMQANCYRALFESCWEEDWLAGVFIWKWFHSTWKYPDYESYLAYRKKRIDSLVALGKVSHHRASMKVFFSPQGREAEKVMKEYFGK